MESAALYLIVPLFCDNRGGGWVGGRGDGIEGGHEPGSQGLAWTSSEAQLIVL